MPGDIHVYPVISQDITPSPSSLSKDASLLLGFLAVLRLSLEALRLLAFRVCLFLLGDGVSTPAMRWPHLASILGS